MIPTGSTFMRGAGAVRDKLKNLSPTGSSTSDSSSDEPAGGGSIGGGDYDPSPIGSGSLNVGVDTDTGRVQESITGMAGTSTPNATSSDDVETVASVTAGDTGTSTMQKTVEKVEQTVEKATGGRAFGTTSAVEDVGSGAATTTVPDRIPDVVNKAQNRLRSAVSRVRSFLEENGVMAVLAVGAAALAGVAALGGDTTSG